MHSQRLAIQDNQSKNCAFAALNTQREILAIEMSETPRGNYACRVLEKPLAFVLLSHMGCLFPEYGSQPFVPLNRSCFRVLCTIGEYDHGILRESYNKRTCLCNKVQKTIFGTACKEFKLGGQAGSFEFILIWQYNRNCLTSLSINSNLIGMSSLWETSQGSSFLHDVSRVRCLHSMVKKTSKPGGRLWKAFYEIVYNSKEHNHRMGHNGVKWQMARSSTQS